ncbi:amino acid ABC transporter permease [Klebsiella michiganensis]|uniref:Amino acid ABC transporter permease n=1 Tax=Klebsiella michiganensis TaxID=1134687 RepID=A0A7H4N287_9ENTR|nr:amino acid ABC transporter permease [Klebsiella michiganensis]
MISMLKSSALVSVIAVQELLLVANQTASASFRYFEALWRRRSLLPAAHQPVHDLPVVA